MPTSDLPISILFSGGSDSSLAAAWAAQQFSMVHLVTCTFRHGYWFDKCQVSIGNLKQRFGENKFQSVFLNTNPFIDAIYFRGFSRGIRKYKHYYLIASYCETCKLAMHTAVIIFNLENGIPYTWEGANHDSAKVFADQKINMLCYFEQLYQEYGIHFRAPVWGIEHSDWELDQLGVVQRKNQKSEHLVYSGQFSCFVDIPLHFWARFAMNEKIHEETALAYFEEKFHVVRQIIADHFTKTGQDLTTLISRLSQMDPAYARDNLPRRTS
jgi:hypothetical protein